MSLESGASVKFRLHVAPSHLPCTLGPFEAHYTLMSLLTIIGRGQGAYVPGHPLQKSEVCLGKLAMAAHTAQRKLGLQSRPS